MSSVLLSIQSLMNDAPYRNEPGFEDKAGPRELTTYNDCIRHETLRVAVCEMFEENDLSRSIPEQLRQLMKGLFGSFYDGYVITCESNMNKVRVLLRICSISLDRKSTSLNSSH